MTLFDTHTHLYLPEFDGDADGNAVDRALAAGVETMMFPNVDLTTIDRLKELHSRYPDNTIMAMGLHPTEVNAEYESALQVISAEAESGTYHAIGEIGMDLYWDKTFRREQMLAFDFQCRLALRLNLPAIIHCREALDETLEVLGALPEKPRAVFHSFGGSAADVERILSTGDFYFGINGIVTFKKSTLPQTLRTIPLDKILLETDSPYLAPVPYRGKRNESAFILATAAKVAETLGMTAEEVAELTTRNARRLFMQ